MRTSLSGTVSACFARLRRYARISSSGGSGQNTHKFKLPSKCKRKTRTFFFTLAINAPWIRHYEDRASTVEDDKGKFKESCFEDKEISGTLNRWGKC